MSRDHILVLNAGSSSVKFAQFCIDDQSSGPALAIEGQVDGIGDSARFGAKNHAGVTLPNPEDREVEAIGDHRGALSTLFAWLDRHGGGGRLRAAGHRVVHGGGQFHKPVRVDPELLATLESFCHLAPHHQPHNVAAIRGLLEQRPDLPQVACFDTAFHASQPVEAIRLPLPRKYWDAGLRRYGFHGLSYEYVTSAFPQRAGIPLPDRTIIAHLGNGASMCAVKDGKSVATTMGFSTLDGLMMGTRCGAMDPGVLIHLMRSEALDIDALEDLLYNRAGLLGASGISSDMRVLLARSEPRAREAVCQYCYRIQREIGSLAAALGGVDALIFTGGVGENAAAIRSMVLQGTAWLGFELDEAANESGRTRLTHDNGNAQAWVVPTDEQAVIARHCCHVLDL